LKALLKCSATQTKENHHEQQHLHHLHLRLPG
jgi:hypothetical protein